MAIHQHNPASVPDPAQQPAVPPVPPQQPAADPKPWTTGQIIHGALTVVLLLAIASLILLQVPRLVPVADALGSLIGGLGATAIGALTLRSARRR
ncbi:hypothetical protein [Streptomyces sp. Qhu_M48]|uniref:hypothetical protein n=1 Tax=Streptomyces sp. Qhu_M48 TaxID=3435889 RepID=UPI003F4FA46A